MKIIIYLISLVFLVVTAFLLPIKKEKTNFLLRVTLVVLFLFNFSILVSIIAYFTHLKASLWLFSIANLLIGIIAFYKILKEKRVQSYKIDIRDIVFIILAIIIVVTIAIVNYGIPFQIKYETTDASSHYLAAVHFMNEEAILTDKTTEQDIFFRFYSMMIGAYVNTGIFFSIFENFITEQNFYILYIIFDMIMLLISSLVMYELTLQLTKNEKLKKIGIIVSFIYVLSYPLNSILMGSAYLTLVLIFIVGIILLFKIKDEIPNFIFNIMLFLLNLGIMQTYTIFSFILIPEIIYLIVTDKRKSIIPILVCVFLPMLTGVIYITTQIDNTIGQALEEGPMYRNYYSNLIMYIPLMIYAIYQNFKNKHKNIETYFLMFFAILVPIVLWKKIQGQVTSYYYFKFYYVLWIIFVTLASKGMYYLLEKHIKIGKIIGGIVLFTLIGSFFYIQTIYTEEELLKDVAKETPLHFSEMFKRNFNFIVNKGKLLNKEEIELIKKAPQYFENKTDKLEIISGEAHIKWCYAFYDYSNPKRDSLEALLELYNPEKIEAEYLLVFKRSTIMHNISNKLLENYEYIYETKYGGVMKRKTNKIGKGEFATQNSTLTGGVYSYKNPIIPIGFKTVDEGANWEVKNDEVEGWNKGVVIEDEIGNQFVWVPIKDGLGEGGIYNDQETVKYKKWYIYEGRDKILETEIGYFEELIGDKIGDLNITISDVKNDNLPKGVEEEENQIIKYGGFYIARFEAGISDENMQKLYDLKSGYDFVQVDERNNQKDIKPISKKDAQVWNFIDYENAKSASEKMYETEAIKSGLMTGTQFDSIMRWAYTSGYDLENAINWGNFYNTIGVNYTGRYASYLRKKSEDWKIKDYGIKSENNRVFTGCGGVKEANMNQIYDIAGNLFEFTTDLYKGKVAMVRGGSAAYEGDKKSTHTTASFSFGDALGYVIGFRVVLYVL